jgi:FixJ family two-component response regulator
MILDDQPEVATTLSTKLAAAGFEVAETTEPEAALEALLEEPDSWGCLITDYDMPGMSGGDILGHLSRKAPDLPVIVVSALAKRLTDPRMKSAHAVLSKPVNTDSLVEAINAALSGASPENKDAHSSR